MQYIGAPLIWRFFKISSQIGIIAKRCVADTPIGHVVFGTDDIIRVSSGTVRSLTDRKNRNAIFNEVDTDNFRRAFVVHNWADSEVWFCYPTTSGDGTCDRAFVLNYVDASSGFRDLPNVMDIKFDIADPVAAAGASDEWDDDSDTWDSDVTDWGQVLFSAVSRKLVGAGRTSSKLYIFNDTNQEDGVNMTSFVERTGIGSEDQTLVKHTTQLFPIMESSGPVNIQVGSQFSSDEAIDWSTPVAFDPNTDHKVDIRKTGRLFALKIESTTDVSWRLYGYNMPTRIVGRQ